MAGPDSTPWTVPCRVLNSGEVSERSKEHAWNACIRLERIAGANPALSARFMLIGRLGLLPLNHPWWADQPGHPWPGARRDRAATGCPMKSPGSPSPPILLPQHLPARTFLLNYTLLNGGLRRLPRDDKL